MGMGKLIFELPQLMKNASSVLLAGTLDGNTFLMSITNIVMSIITFICQLLYTIAKWALYFVDVLFFYIRQLSGMNTDTSSINRLISKDSDMVFNFLLSNNDIVTRIIKNLLALSAILIIVFSIIAIIKNQFDSLKTGKASSVNDVLKTTIKSILLMFVTPFIAILGIAASNILLKSLYNATNVSGAASLSTQVFSAASNSANMYRRYAGTGDRIPITFDFSKQEEIIKYYKEEGSSSKMLDYLTSAENTIYTTYLAFKDQDFDKFKDLEAYNGSGLNIYYESFDKDISANESEPLYEYKRIRAYNEEYYVMADVLDYAVTSSAILHIKTIEEVFDYVVYTLEKYVGEPASKQIFNALVADFGVSFYAYNNLNEPLENTATHTLYDIYKTDLWSVIRFTNIYYSADEEGEPLAKKQIQYNHVRGSLDECEGAVFIMTGQRDYTNPDGTIFSYYYPLSRGYSEYKMKAFDSEYIERNKITIARGVFSKDGYPTAIKKVVTGEDNASSEVIFYRHVLEPIVLGSANEILNSDFKDEGGGIISKVVNFFKSLVDPSRLFPFLNYKPEEMVQTYTSVAIQCGKLDAGELHVGYLFTDSLTSAIAGDTYGLQLYTLFNPSSLNYLILVLGAYILIKICFLTVFALVNRSYELFMIILIYPVTCSTMPLDNGNSYKYWVNSYASKLFTTYGLFLGFNFILMLFPVINTIQVFKPHDIASTPALYRFSRIFTAINISINTQAALLNFTCAILFQLVAFSFLEGNKKGEGSIYRTISKIVNPNSKDDLYSANAGAMMFQTFKNAGIFIAKTIAVTKGAVDIVTMVAEPGQKRLKERIASKLPGSALFAEAQKKQAAMQKKEELEQQMYDLENGTLPKSPPKTKTP